jgi:alanine-synthesizing transaminase
MFARRTQWKLQRNQFSEALDRARQNGAKLIDLTISNPTEAGFDFDRSAIKAATSEAMDAPYRPEPKGMQLAREAVAGYYAEQQVPVKVDPANIVITASTSEAYSYLFRLVCEPGDEVLAAQPSYPLFDFLADIQDVKLTQYPLFYDHGWHVDLHTLRRALTPRTRAVMVVNPNNPTGSFVSNQERDELAEICVQRDIPLIVDEVFLDYPFTEAPQSFAGETRAMTFTLSGLSKIAGMPQMKVAWLVANGPDERVGGAMERLEVIADTYLSVSTPMQHAIPAMLAVRSAFQSQLRVRLHTNLEQLDAELAKQHLCSRLAVQGGWYATLRVPVTGSDEDLAVALLERAQVVAHPGHFFDFTSDGYLVLSLMTPESVFAEGVRRILRHIQSS